MAKTHHVHILPSILSADPLALGQEVDAVVQAGIDMIHLDIMDHHYVPNLTYGPLVCRALHQQFPNVALDVHLMVSPVDDLIEQFAQNGSTRISFHPEASLHVDRSLQLIRSLGCQAGLALNPATSIDWLTWCRHRLDFVLVMTVNPGFGGQKLIEAIIPKIKAIHAAYPDLPIAVDGGVSPQTITPLKQAGAQQFVVGSALFGTDNYARTLKLLWQA